MHSSDKSKILYTIAIGLIATIATLWILAPSIFHAIYHGKAWAVFNNLAGANSQQSIHGFLRNMYLYLTIMSIAAVFIVAVTISKTARTPFILVRHPAEKTFIVVSLSFSILLLLTLSKLQLIGYTSSAIYINMISLIGAGYLVISWGFRHQFGRDLTQIAPSPHLNHSILKFAEKYFTAIIIGILFVALGARLLTYHEAFERDLMAYMSVADRLLDGWALYGDVWDHKPPAIHWTYALFAKLFGVSPLALFAMGYLAFALTLWGCYSAGKHLAGSTGGLLSASVWALLSGDIFTQANQPNTEVFMNASLAWALALMLKEDNEKPCLRYAIIGLLFFIASLYKTVIIPVAIVVMITHFIFGNSAQRTQRKKRFCSSPFYQVTFAGSIAIFCWGSIFAGFYFFGDFHAFYGAVVEYNQAYAGNLWENLWVSPYKILSSLWFYPILWLLIANLFFVTYFTIKRKERKVAILLAYFLGIWISISLPGKHYYHYFQLFFPAIAVTTGWMLASANNISNRYFLSLAFTLLLFPVASRAFQLFIPTDTIPIVKYGNYGIQALESKELASWINSNFDTKATIYNWGASPELYFWSRRATPVKFLYSFPLIQGDKRSEMYSQTALSQLIKLKPDLVITDMQHLQLRDHPIVKWLIRDYKRISGPVNITKFIFLVREEPNIVVREKPATPNTSSVSN